MNDEELKLLAAHELDVTTYLDAIGMSFEELIEITFEELNEEQRQALRAAVD